MRSYKALLEDVMQNGENRGDRTGVGTRSVFGRQWRHNLKDGFPLLTTKQVTARWVFEELKWFLSGSTNAKDLQDKGVTIWDEWATDEQCAKFDRPAGDLGPIYGGLWRNFQNSGEDQIADLLTGLQNNPMSRRHIVTGWSPRDSRRVALPPCHTLWQMYVHNDGSMSLELYARSIDIFLGLPYNIASYAFLLKMITTVLNTTPCELIISFGDLHIYQNHFEQVKTQLSRDPYPLPQVEIAAPVFDDPLTSLLGITWQDVTITGYEHHPKIPAPVAI